MAHVEKTRSLRAFISRAEFATKLLAPPTAYDLAPRYVLDAYRASSAAISKALTAAAQDPAYARIAQRDIAKDVRIALELAAPIALGGVRVFLVGASLIAYASNPVTLVLGGPALLLTGKRV